MQKIQEALLNAYLDLSKESSDLRDMAYAKAVLWILYAEKTYLDIDEIIYNIAELVKIESVPKASIYSALKLLLLRKLIVENVDKWKLSDSQLAEMDSETNHSFQVTYQIIIKRFPRKIDQQKIKRWFEEANSDYFSLGAEKLISLHTTNQKPVFNVEAALKPLIEKHGLKLYHKELIQGYKEFLTSNDKDEKEKVFNLIRSILSARLVAANVAPESLSVERYKDSEMLIDTNVLFELGLFRSEEIDHALKALGSATKSLNIKLSIAEFTYEEYENVRTREKDNFMKIVDAYGENIFSGMNSNDSFVQSMKKLGCKTREDVETFFDSNLKPPEKLGDNKITILKYSELKNSDYSPTRDVDLMNQIREETHKKEKTAIHDLRLTKLAEYKSDNRKTFILTFDSQMETYSLAKVGDKEEPLWLSIYSLIQILALNGGGVEYNPNDLSPLIKMFFEFEEATKEEKYDERDLMLLLEKRDRINELPEEKVISLLNQLHRSRLARSDEEAVRSITLEFDRSLRQNAFSLDQKVLEKQEIIEALQRKNIDKEKDVQKLNKDLNKQKIQKAYFFFFCRILLYAACAVGLFFFLKSDIYEAVKNNNHYEIYSTIIPIGTIFLAAFSDYINFTKPFIDKLYGK